MFKVADDIHNIIRERKMVILILLDLSSAFDTIDQVKLLEKLDSDFGICENANEWFQSYLKGRIFAVRIGEVNRRK